MDKVKFTQRRKDNKPKLIKRVLFHLYRLRHNKYYNCHILSLCVNCEYFNICYDEKVAAGQRRKNKRGTGADERKADKENNINLSV